MPLRLFRERQTKRTRTYYMHCSNTHIIGLEQFESVLIKTKIWRPAKTTSCTMQRELQRNAAAVGRTNAKTFPCPTLKD